MTILIALALAAADLPKKAPLEQHPGIETVAGVVEGPGGHDWIMDRGDQEQIVRLVGPSARLLVVPRADHSFSQHPDAKTAFQRMGNGEYPADAANEILTLVRGR